MDGCTRKGGTRTVDRDVVLGVLLGVATVASEVLLVLLDVVVVLLVGVKDCVWVDKGDY